MITNGTNEIKKSIHVPVLLQETIDSLLVKKGDVVVDATIGGGGHSFELCRRYGKDIKIIGIDEDESALSQAQEKLKACDADISFVRGNFRDVKLLVDRFGIIAVDKIIFDLGLRSDQLESGRGFTFQKDEPLTMTFQSTPGEGEMTAYDVVNTWDEENLALILEAYGEERYAKRIAKKIVERRAEAPIKTTFELVDVVRSATPRLYHFGRIHPATRTFQAIRIAVNDEIQALKEGLEKSFEILAPSGRMAIISFHSLEDREVKRFGKEKHDQGVLKILTKKPIIPSNEEIKENPRSRSAKLRVFEKIQ